MSSKCSLPLRLTQGKEHKISRVSDFTGHPCANSLMMCWGSLKHKLTSCFLLGNQRRPQLTFLISYQHSSHARFLLFDLNKPLCLYQSAWARLYCINKHSLIFSALKQHRFICHLTCTFIMGLPNICAMSSVS
jgi:hypothetical protein